MGARSVLGWKRPRPIRWFLQPEPSPGPPGEPYAQGRGMEHFVGIDVAKDRLDRGLCGRAVIPLPSCANGKDLAQLGVQSRKLSVSHN